MLFLDDEHEKFYLKHSLAHNVYYDAFIYTIGISEDTRRNLSELYDYEKDAIIPGALNAGWQTSGSVQVTRMAFHLYTGGIPCGEPAKEFGYAGQRVQSVEQIVAYTPAELFACSYAPYFVEALKLRFPEYMLI